MAFKQKKSAKRTTKKRTIGNAVKSKARGMYPWDRPNFERAVSHGFVEFGPERGDRGRVIWNWKLIRKIWSVDTEHNTIRKFSDYWGLDYRITRQHVLKADKQEAEKNRIALGKVILDAVSIPDQKDIQSASALIGRVLGDAIRNIEGLNLYVAGRLLNIDIEGRRNVNIKLSVAEVAQLALVQKRATDQLSRLLDVRHTIQDADDMPQDAEYIADKQSVPRQQDVIARIVKGGIARVPKAEGQEE